MSQRMLRKILPLLAIAIISAACAAGTESGDGRPAITAANAAQVVELGPIPQNTDWVFTVAWAADDAFVYVASQGEGTHVWNATTGEDIGELPFTQSFAVDPTGHYVAGAAGRDSLAILKTDRMEVLHELDIQNWARAMAFTPDGLSFATGHQVNGWNARPGTSLLLWDVSTGTVIRAFDHTENVDTIAINTDGTLIAAAGEDENINVWDITNGDHIATLSEPHVMVAAIAFSPDGSLVASASGPGGKVTLWDVASGQIARVVRDEAEFSSSVVFSPDGSVLASASRDGTMQLWDVATGEELAIFQLEAVNETLSLLKTNSLAFNYAGTLITAGMSDGSVRLFGLPTD